ncbi:MAG: PDZ domain-containing protein [Dehalogenimonas sp.]
MPVTDIDGNLVVGFDPEQLERYLAQARTAAAPPFGASVADARKITASLGLPAVSGAYIGAVKPGLPAAAAGLKPGDIITRIDTAAISSAADLDRALSGLEKGARIRITFVRDGSPRQAEGML